MRKSSTSSFVATRWTLVLEASAADTPTAKAALSELCEIYYEPVVAFIRQWRNDNDEDAARNTAHAFFESILAKEHSPIGSPSPSRGRFRSYLLGAVKFFISEQHRRESTAKRGGVAEFIDIDDHDPPSNDSIDFDREWAVAVVRRALTELETEMNDAGKSAQFQALKPWLDGNATATQSAAAEALSISETAVKVAIHRLRERFRAKVRKEVAATLRDQSELDQEMAHLVNSLAMC